MIENKMNRHHNFAWLHAVMSHCLTVMLGVYFFILDFEQPVDKESSAEEYAIADQEYVTTLQVIGFSVYLSVVAAMIVSFAWYKCK